MASKLNRVTVDLEPYPELVVIYLGMRVHSFRGLATLIRLGPQIEKAVAAKPEGLLLHENVTFSIFPLHVGMRQYWRDFESLETWARSLPHKKWWVDFLKNPGGTGFWHETYFRNGGIEAVYDNLFEPVGMMTFAPRREAKGAMFSARKRAGIGGKAKLGEPVPEE